MTDGSKSMTLIVAIFATDFTLDTVVTCFPWTIYINIHFIHILNINTDVKRCRKCVAFVKFCLILNKYMGPFKVLVDPQQMYGPF